MSAIEEAKYHLFQLVTAIVGNDSLVEDIIIDYPPANEWGDLSLACFVLGKSKGQAPAELAKALAGSLKPDAIIAECRAVGPYLNCRLQTAWLFERLLIESAQTDYGQSQSRDGEKILIEYSNVNTHKEYHIGHVRNLIYGDSVANLLHAAGAEVIKSSYVNDFGIHVARTLWQIGLKPDKNLDGFTLGKLYAEASQRLAQDNPADKAAVAAIMQKIEARRGQFYKLWQRTRRLSLKYFADIYKRLQINFAESYYESEVIDEGRALVDKLLAEGVLQNSQGAIVADLSGANLGVLVFVRSDGTALYPVADLALAAKKFVGRQLSESVYVVDKRQSLYFQQLFYILRLAGFDIKLTHLAYDFVKLPQGAMSSRSGQVVSFAEVITELTKALTKEITDRHTDWSAKKIKATAETLSVAVIKWEMIKVSADKVITFDLQAALRFDGYTATYIEYSLARINSLLKKAGLKSQGARQADFDDKEQKLILASARLPEIIRQAASAYEPSVLTKYLFDLARLFNDYYQAVPILKGDKAKIATRLQLITAVGRTLKAGLAVLGIDSVKEM